MVAGVCNATFMTMELPITFFFSSAGMNRLVVNNGLDFRVMPPLPDHYPASLGSVSGHAGSALAKGTWLTLGMFSTVRS